MPICAATACLVGYTARCRRVVAHGAARTRILFGEEFLRPVAVPRVPVWRCVFDFAQRVTLDGVAASKNRTVGADFVVPGPNGQHHDSTCTSTSKSAHRQLARHYEIGTDRPIFAGRDAVKRYALSEIERAAPHRHPVVRRLAAKTPHRTISALARRRGQPRRRHRVRSRPKHAVAGAISALPGRRDSGLEEAGRSSLIARGGY